MKSIKHILLFLILVFLCSTTFAQNILWIGGLSGPKEWTIDPSDPNENDPIYFSGPAILSANSCYAEIILGGTPTVSVDTINKIVEIMILEPAPDECVAAWDPVCGLEGDFGPLAPGNWVFKCTNPYLDFEINFTVSSIKAPTTYYVDQDAPGSTHDGSMWKKAFTNIQGALDVAVAGDTILIAEGVYKPDQGDSVTEGDRTASCELKGGVNLYGGYAGYGNINQNERNPKKYPTIISGDLDEDDMGMLHRDDNSYQVIRAIGADSEAVVLDGFIIEAGQADGPAFFNSGGGIYASGINLILVRCTITNNIAGIGGGVFCENGILSLLNCMVTGNKSLVYGGGLYSYSTTVSMTNCLVVGNSATLAEFFGGSAVFNLGGDMTISDCTIADNLAPNGMAIASFTWFLPKNVDFIVNNSILYNGGNEIFTNHMTGVSVFNTDIQDGWTGTGSGNIDNDPLFVENGFWGLDEMWNDGDYQLQQSSLCIDQGNNSLLPKDVADLDGDSNTSESLPVDINDTDRIKNDIVDMGAYESSSSYTPEPNESVRVINIATIVPDDIGPSYPPRNYSFAIELTYEEDYQATLRVEIEAASAADGTWSAWLDPEPGVIGPGEVFNVEIRGLNVDIAQLSPGQQTIATLRVFIQPQS